MKIDWMFWFMILVFVGCFFMLESIDPNIILTSAYAEEYPGCQLLKLETGYSIVSEEEVKTAMEKAVDNWLKANANYEFVRKLDSMTTSDSNGGLTVFYLVRSKQII